MPLSMLQMSESGLVRASIRKLIGGNAGIESVEISKPIERNVAVYG